MFQWKLHTKFLVFVLGSVILVLGTLSFLFIRREARLISQKNIETQHVLAASFAEDLAENMLEGRPRSTLNLMKAMQKNFNLARLEVLREDGSRAFGRAAGRIDAPRLAEAFSSGREVDFQETGDPPLSTIVIPLTNEASCRRCHKTNGAILGAVLVSVSREDDIREIIKSRRDLSFLFSAAIGLIGLILYAMIRKVVLGPLTQLHQGAERLGRGDFAHRIALPTRDELQDLALAFNAMAGRIEESYSGLEDAIRERTSQLHTALGEIQEKASRLYAYSRDMATISRLSTKVFNVDVSLDEMLDRFMWSLARGLGYRETMLCLVDRKRVWLDVKRDTGLGNLLPFRGQSLLSNDPIISIVRKSNIEVLDRSALGNAGIELHAGLAKDDPHEFYFIPLLNRKHNNKCWQVTSCIKTDCPAYADEKAHCWLVDNTLCGNPIRESYGSKLAYCMTCQMFPVIGVLIVAADVRKQPLRNRNVGVLRILAAEIASALENRRLHEANQQMVRELLELHRVTAAALADLSLMKALEVFTDSALKFAGLDACYFWLMTPDGRELVRQAGGNIDNEGAPDDQPDRLPADSGLLGRALLQKSNFVIDYDVAAHDPGLGAAARSTGMHSLLAVPLKSEGGPLGVFTVHKRGTMPFLETEVAAFMLLANQAAMTVNVCMLSDELKVQNRELARHTGLLSGILSNMSSGIMLLDENTTIALVNQVGADILQTGRDLLLNKQLSSFFPEASAFVSSAVGSYQEMEIRLRNGTTVPIGYSKTFYRSSPGESEGIIVVFRDLSEIKTLQAELLNKERFAAMGRVVAGVAHEIRNPLFGISSVGQILEREIHDPAHQELIRALLSESRRMNQLVEELLLYGRPMKLNPESCDVAAIWGEVINMHRSELERKQIVINGDLQVKHMTALLDTNQIRQVFLNLLRNAIDAADRGGAIDFRVLLEDRHIVVKISDTGRGIPANDLDRIFDLFYTTKPKGTGLGLAICKKIVQDHGGDISVESKEGKGSAFTIKLPYRGIPADPVVAAT